MSQNAVLKVDLPRYLRAKWLCFFGFLTLFAVLDTVHTYVAHRGEGTPTSIETAILAGLVYWLPYYFLVPAAVFLLDRYRLDFERARSFVIHSIGGLVFTYVHLFFAALYFYMPHVGPDGHPLGYWERFFTGLKFDFAIDYLFYFGIVVTVYMLQQYSSLKDGEIRASQLEASLAQTRLRALQAQLNPHFFFNTLQGISVLALAGERDRVVDMLGRLSSLLRVSFDKHRPQQFPLTAEMEFLDSYLAIHQLSFGPRLIIQYDVAADTLNAVVPSMLLQPLVENAIVHGLAVKPGRGTIRIGTRKLGGRLLLTIADSGHGFTANGPQQRGVGLSATESRLQVLYGSEQTMDFGRSDLGGALVTIVIPFEGSAVSAKAALNSDIAA